MFQRSGSGQMAVGCYLSNKTSFRSGRTWIQKENELAVSFCNTPRHYYHNVLYYVNKNFNHFLMVGWNHKYILMIISAELQDFY